MHTGARSSGPESTSLARLVGASCAAFAAGVIATILLGATLSLVPASITRPITTEYDTLLVYVFVGAFFAVASAVGVVIIDGGRPRFVGAAPVAASLRPAHDADTGCAEAIALVRQPVSPSTNTWLTFLGSFILFAVWIGAGSTLVSMLVVGATLLLHEAGHWFAMRVFGYQDTRIFFVPFFGAVTTGRKVGAPGWQECTVLLMGPLPGLLLAVALCFVVPLESHPWLRTGVRALVWINVLNLLPLAGLDGGRLLSRVLFSRRPLLESLADGAMGFGMVMFGLNLSAWFLVAIGAFTLFMIHARHRVATAAFRLRDAHASSAVDLTTAPDAYLEDLYWGVRAAFGGKTLKPAVTASWMRGIHERLLAVPLGVGATLTFLALYFGAWVVGLLGALLIVSHGTH